MGKEFEGGRPRLSDLPKDLQRVVIDGLTKPHEWVRWSMDKEFVAADPGMRLSILRLQREWTQEELAVEAGVTQEDVAVAEDNFGKSKIEILEKITRALGTTPKDLMFKHS